MALDHRRRDGRRVRPGHGVGRRAASGQPGQRRAGGRARVAHRQPRHRRRPVELAARQHRLRDHRAPAAGGGGGRPPPQAGRGRQGAAPSPDLFRGGRRRPGSAFVRAGPGLAAAGHGSAGAGPRLGGSDRRAADEASQARGTAGTGEARPGEAIRQLGGHGGGQRRRLPGHPPRQAPPIGEGRWWWRLEQGSVDRGDVGGGGRSGGARRERGPISTVAFRPPIQAPKKFG